LSSARVCCVWRGRAKHVAFEVRAAAKHVAFEVRAAAKHVAFEVRAAAKHVAFEVRAAAHRLLAHVVEVHPGHRLAVFAQVHDKGVRPEGLALDEEIGNSHRLVGHQPLADPVLVRAEVGRVEVECLPARRRVKDDTREVGSGKERV
jgi:hypothetical protein